MAKVISHGTHYNAYYPSKVTCPDCQAVFIPHWRIVKKDMIPLCLKAYIYVNCVCCDEKINLNLPYEQWHEVFHQDKEYTLNLDQKLPEYKIVTQSMKYSKITCSDCNCVFLLCKDAVRECPECHGNIDHMNSRDAGIKLGRQ